MANELICIYPTGNTLYAHLFDATGQIYNGSTFEAPQSANWANYDIALSEAATATQIYRGTMPTVAAGEYSFTVRLQAGGSPAVTDIAVGVGSISWNGTAVCTLADTADAVWDEDITGHTGSNSAAMEMKSHATHDDAGDLMTEIGDVPTAAENADAVWDEAKSGHVGGGSFGEEVQAHALSSEVAALNDLSAAQVNAEVDTALSDYDPPTKAEMDTGFAGMPTAIDIAGTVLKRDWTVVTGEADRSLLNALRFLRNKWSISGTTLTVTKEDDTTTAWTAAVSSSSGADPVIGVDPT